MQVLLTCLPSSLELQLNSELVLLPDSVSRAGTKPGVSGCFLSTGQKAAATATAKMPPQQSLANMEGKTGNVKVAPTVAPGATAATNPKLTRKKMSDK